MMASQIDPRFPEFGHATTESVRENFQHAKDEVEELQTNKAPLESPEFIDNPRAPTAPQSSNDTTIASTEFVHTAVSALEDIDGGDF